MDSVLELSALETAQRIRNRELSPLEITEKAIARIEAVNPQLNALVADRFEAARDEARAAEQRLSQRNGGELPPLFGVPCTIKEFYAVTGMPQTGGIPRRRNERPGQDALVVQRVRRAGAIVLGVTNVPEGGLWMESNNFVYGRSNNPWDIRRTPGGSSGGEAAIVAAGGSTFGMGSDIGGSIRLPSAFCGLAGHKPSGRLVPLDGHWPPMSGALAGFQSLGPMARSAKDLHPLMRIIVDGDPRLGRLEDVDLSKVTVYPVETNGTRPRQSMRRAVREAARALERRGARLAELDPELLRGAFFVWGAMMNAPDAPSYAELCSGNQELSVLREILRALTGRGRHTTPALAVMAIQSLSHLLPPRLAQRLTDRGARLQRALEEVLGPNGVILHPPYTRPAPRHMTPLLTPFDAGYTSIFNALEFPVTQVPTGLDPRGLPVGVQVAARRGNDHLTLAVAEALEEEFGRLTPVSPRLRARPGADMGPHRR